MSNADESMKFVWAYMLEEGHITNGKWSFYMGTYGLAESSKEYKFAKDELDTELKMIGIDWEKTKEPQSSFEREFTDTFHPSKEVETLLGTLVLKNGTEYLIGVGNSEKRFSGYLKMLSELAKDKERVRRVLGEENV